MGIYGVTMVLSGVGIMNAFPTSSGTGSKAGVRFFLNKPLSCQMMKVENLSDVSQLHPDLGQGGYEFTPCTE